MRLAAGALGWSEEQFWGSSMAWFRAAIEGRAEMLGVRVKPLPAMDRVRKAELFAKADATVAAIEAKKREAGNGA